MTRISKGELIFGFLTPILGVIGFSIFMFAPIQTVGVTINEGPMVIQHMSIFSESNGNALSQYLLVHAIVFLLTLSVAASAAVHAATGTRAAAVVLCGCPLRCCGLQPIRIPRRLRPGRTTRRALSFPLAHPFSILEHFPSLAPTLSVLLPARFSLLPLLSRWMLDAVPVSGKPYPIRFIPPVIRVLFILRGVAESDQLMTNCNQVNLCGTRL